MTQISANGLILLIWASLAAAGCGGSAPPPKKVVRLGAGDAGAPAPAVAPAPAAAGAANAAKQPSSTSKSRNKLTDSRDESSEEIELGYGEQLYAVLPESAPAGVPFAIDGPDPQTNVNRFAFVSGDPDVDSSDFAITRSGGPSGLPSVSPELGTQLKDDSTTSYELPSGFVPIGSGGTSTSGLPWRVRCEADGAVMALVPEGVFTQGTNKGAPNAAPEHGVLLNAFYVDLLEVSSARYEQFRDEAGEKRRVPRPARSPKNPKEPVLGVTWGEAHAYALWAGKDLPTEAQWEKAARGPEGFAYPWGNGPFIWHRPREPQQIDPVGTFRGDVSPYGVFDMAGNAREWCNDWYVEKYYAQLVAEAGATARNPGGPKSSNGTNMRVVKGGDPAWHVWARAGVVQSERPNDVGFRCVLKLKPLRK
jgi:formylglycine-generating enzyme required for sulfatase activity